MGMRFHSVSRRRTVCHISLDWKNADNHFAFLWDKTLFDRLNDACDVIYIVSNKYFAEFLIQPSFAGYYERLASTFPSPYKNIAELLLQPQYRVRVKYEKIKGLFKNKKYLSIHARGFYDDGEGTEKAFECANKLLMDGKISYVFYATESARLVSLAKKLIKNKAKLITLPKEVVHDEKRHMDSFSIRGNLAELDNALVEWYLIGEATYCMSPTIGESTFSKTAIARGNCRYIPVVLGSECEETTIVIEKESYVTMHQELHIERGRHVTNDMRERIWSSVVKTVENGSEQCIPSMHKDFISRYWDQDLQQSY